MIVHLPLSKFCGQIWNNKNLEEELPAFIKSLFEIGGDLPFLFKNPLYILCLYQCINITI